MPRKKFEECGRRAQQKKTQNLLSEVSTSELSFAAQMSGKRELQNLCKLLQHLIRQLVRKNIRLLYNPSKELNET